MRVCVYMYACMHMHTYAHSYTDYCSLTLSRWKGRKETHFLLYTLGTFEVVSLKIMCAFVIIYIHIHIHIFCRPRALEIKISLFTLFIKQENRLIRKRCPRIHKIVRNLGVLALSAKLLIAMTGNLPQCQMVQQALWHRKQTTDEYFKSSTKTW